MSNSLTSAPHLIPSTTVPLCTRCKDPFPPETIRGRVVYRCRACRSVDAARARKKRERNAEALENIAESSLGKKRRRLRNMPTFSTLEGLVNDYHLALHKHISSPLAAMTESGVALGSREEMAFRNSFADTFQYAGRWEISTDAMPSMEKWKQFIKDCAGRFTSRSVVLDDCDQCSTSCGGYKFNEATNRMQPKSGVYRYICSQSVASLRNKPSDSAFSSDPPLPSPDTSHPQSTSSVTADHAAPARGNDAAPLSRTPPSTSFPFALAKKRKSCPIMERFDCRGKLSVTLKVKEAVDIGGILLIQAEHAFPHVAYPLKALNVVDGGLKTLPDARDRDEEIVGEERAGVEETGDGEEDDNEEGGDEEDDGEEEEEEEDGEEEYDQERAAEMLRSLSERLRSMANAIESQMAHPTRTFVDMVERELVWVEELKNDLLELAEESDGP